MGSLPRTSAHQSPCSLYSSPYWWQSPWRSPTTPTPWAPMWVTIPVSTLASTISTVSTISMVSTTQECSLQSMGICLLRLSPRWSPTPTTLSTTSTKEQFLLSILSALWSTTTTLLMLPPTFIPLSTTSTREWMLLLVLSVLLLMPLLLQSTIRLMESTLTSLD